MLVLMVAIAYLHPAVSSTYPSAAQGVHIRTTDTAMRHSHVNVGLLPWLGLELLPNHLALGGLLVKAHPTLELVVGGSHCE